MADDDGLPLDAGGKPDLAKAPVWVRFLAGKIDEGNAQKEHLHECLHRIEKVVQEDRHAARNRDMAQDRVISTLQGAVENITSSFDGLKGEVTAIAQGLGVQQQKEGEAKPKKALALLSKRQAILSIVGVASGAVVLYKIITAVVAWLFQSLPALHHALLAIG